MNPPTSPSRAIAPHTAPAGASVTTRRSRRKSNDLHCTILEALIRGKAARASLRKKDISDEERLAELRQARQSLENAVEQVKRTLAERDE